MIYLPDTNTCISLLRQKQPHLIARWQSTKVSDITLHVEDWEAQGLVNQRRRVEDEAHQPLP